MNRNVFVWAALAALTLIPGAHAARLTDDLGRTVVISTPVRRIVSLSPSATENLFAIGAGEKVVAVITADDTPGVKGLPRVGDFYRPSIERIRALKPDLVIHDTATADRASLDNFQKRLKLPLYVQKSRVFADVPRHLVQLGQITGTQAKARQVAAAMNSKVAQAQRIVRGKPRVSVFVEINATPLYAAGPGSFVHDLIGMAGGRNVVAGGTPFPMYSKEALLAANPDFYIIAQGGVMGRPTAHPKLNPPLDRLAAARKDRVRALDADILLRPTPRLADGLLALARALHG